MPSPPDDFRRLIKSFSPQSNEYWQDVGRVLFGAMPEEEQQQIFTCIGRVTHVLMLALRFLIAQLFPVIECIGFERRLRPAIEAGKQNYDLPERANGYMTLSKDALKDSLKIGNRSRPLR